MRNSIEQHSVKRVLLFDDDRDYRNLLRTYLSKYLQGVEVIDYDPVTKGAPADDFDWGAYDVLILDYYLCIYGLTGLDLLQKNRTKPGFPATIMLTGAGDEELAVRALSSGVYQYLRKEKLSKEELIEAIHAAFNKHREELVKRSERERASKTFDKTRFYRHLEHAPETMAGANERVLLLIDVDNIDALTATSGLIMQDNLFRYLARATYEKLKTSYNDLYITRLGGSSLGVVIPDPGDIARLQDKVHELCEHFDRGDYVFSDKPVKFTVSIGILMIGRETAQAVSLIAAATQARDVARRTDGNSCHLAVLTEILKLEQERRREEEEKRKAEAERQRQMELEKQQQEQARREAELERRRAQEQRKQEQVKKQKERERRKLEEAQRCEAEERLRLEEDAKRRQEEQRREEAPLPAETEKPAATDEFVIDEAALDQAALALKKAFDENRAVLTFQPMVAMFTPDTGTAADLFRVDIRLIDANGNVLPAAEIRTRNTALPLHQFMDRWILREMIGRIVNNDDLRSGKIFIIPMSEAWLSDITLFNWLQHLLTGVELVRPGKSIMLEVPVAMLAAHEKKAVALIKALKKSHGFRIALGGINSADEAQKAMNLLDFDLYTIKYGLMDQFRNHPAVNPESLKQQATRIVIDNVEDATMLTNAISLGADYVMGDFIGTAETYITGSGNVETFDII